MGELVNILGAEVAGDDTDPDRYRALMLRVGPLLGARDLGLSVYELPPGQSICPYHFEYPEEEWLLVLDGTPTLRHPEGHDVLEPWDLVCFLSGPTGAHKVTNHTESTVRVAMLSTKSALAVCVYPDSNKVGVFSGDGEVAHRFRLDASLDYFDGEI